MTQAELVLTSLAMLVFSALGFPATWFLARTVDPAIGLPGTVAVIGLGGLGLIGLALAIVLWIFSSPR